MRIVADTSVWFVVAALAALREESTPVVVPAVVFTERARQLLRDGLREPGEFAAEIAEAGWTIEPYGVEEASRFAARFVDDARWRRLARDAMIAGHVRPEDRLWTSNPRDFLAVGVPGGSLVDVSAL